MVRGRSLLLVVGPCVLLLLLLGLLSRGLSWPQAPAQWPGAALLAASGGKYQEPGHAVEAHQGPHHTGGTQEKQLGRWVSIKLDQLQEHN